MSKDNISSHKELESTYETVALKFKKCNICQLHMIFDLCNFKVWVEKGKDVNCKEYLIKSIIE